MLKITGAVDICTGDALRTALLAYLHEQPAVVLDLSQVDICDTTALQLLYATRRSAERSNKPFRLVAVSPAIEQTCAALGICLETEFRDVEATDGI